MLHVVLGANYDSFRSGSPPGPQACVHSPVPRSPGLCAQPSPQAPRLVCTALKGAVASHRHQSHVSHLFLRVKIRKSQPGMMAHVCNPRTQVAEAGGLLQVQDQPGLYCYILH